MKILATLCYVQNKDKTLMLFRNKKKNDYHKGKWNGLGGKFEPGESPEECASREVFEESGLKVLKQTMKGFLTFPLFDGENDWHVFIFRIDKFSGDIIESKEGTLAWQDTTTLSSLNLWEGDRIFLPLIHESGFFSGKFEYENGKLKQYIIHNNK